MNETLIKIPNHCMIVYVRLSTLDSNKLKGQMKCKNKWSKNIRNPLIWQQQLFESIIMLGKRNIVVERFLVEQALFSKWNQMGINGIWLYIIWCFFSNCHSLLGELGFILYGVSIHLCFSFLRTILHLKNANFFLNWWSWVLPTIWICVLF